MLNQSEGGNFYRLYNEDIPDDVQLVGDLAIDTEATGLNFIQRDRLCLVQICDSADNIYLIKFNQDYSNSKNLKKVLSDEKIQKIFHFARFDVAIMSYYLKVEIKNIFCTKIASKLCRTYTSLHGLKELCRELLGIYLNKKSQCSDWAKHTLDPDQIDYAISDVIYLHNLRKKLIEMLSREDKLCLFADVCSFLNTRIKLDILGYKDIFSHTDD